jgi:hypothetical protein
MREKVRESMQTLFLANLFCAGILAGMEIAIHYGVSAPSAALDDRSQLLFRQGLIRKLRILVPSFFLPVMLSAVTIMILDRAAPGFWLRCAGFLALLVWVVARVIATVPANSATLDWDADAPPPNWKNLVARAERFHILGVWAAVFAFACLLSALAVK